MVIILAKENAPSRDGDEDGGGKMSFAGLIKEPVTLAVLVCSMACGRLSGIPI